MLNKIDYLLIGHITVDRYPGEDMIGGTVVYSALTAKALGLKVGIITSWAEELNSNVLDGINVVNYKSNLSTTFENVYTENGRVQKIYSVANLLGEVHVPNEWINTEIVHFGPVAREISPKILDVFKASFFVTTPQGWFRKWSADGVVSIGEWPEARLFLRRMNAVVVSTEDLCNDNQKILELAHYCKVLAVTSGDKGIRVFWNGEEKTFYPLNVNEVDATGAGDIFATTFFIRLFTTHDPWDAAKFASILASYSVTRKGLDSIPTEDEIKKTIDNMDN